MKRKKSFEKLSILNKAIYLIIIALIAFNINTYVNLSKKIKIIGVTDAYRLYKSKKVVFIDARNTIIYNEEHILDSINIPYSLNCKFGDIYDKDDYILITYCDNDGCNLGYLLAREIIRLGFKKVYFMNGGIEEWKKKGYPVVNKKEDK